MDNVGENNQMKKPTPGSRATANNQAKRIRQYWRDQGYDVSPRVLIVARIYKTGRKKKEPIWGVRSDMVNGIPVRRVQ